MKKGKIGGLIAAHKLEDWWISEFSEDEREYICMKYQSPSHPMGELTEGIFQSSQSTVDFLGSFSTWFTGKNEIEIFQKIRKKLLNLSAENQVLKPGYLNGRHFSTYVEDVQQLLRQNETNKAKNLLRELINATENQNKELNCGVAPWYYEALSKIYRKEKDYQSEVLILERFSKQKHAPGKKPELLMQRLIKAQELANKKS